LQVEEGIYTDLRELFRQFNDVEYANREIWKKALEASQKKTASIVFSFTGGAVLLVLVGALILTRYISARISKISALADNIAKGNYTAQVEEHGNNEFTELTRSMNRMSSMLNTNVSLLQRKNKELDSFAYVVAHDLKAPLLGINSLISVIFEDHKPQIPAEVLKYLQLINDRIDKSRDLIQGILTYARIGKETPPKEQIEVGLLLNDIVSSLAVREGLSVSVAAGMPVIFSHKIPLIQIFNNLISNAIKYHDKPQGEVKVYYKDEGNHYVFFVEDDGAGIDELAQKKVFEIFETLEVKANFESTGIGLAIVKKIIEDRNETINLTSIPGKGSIFSFTWTKS
jgi:signal transduction histidine kinase